MTSSRGNNFLTFIHFRIPASIPFFHSSLYTTNPSNCLQIFVLITRLEIYPKNLHTGGAGIVCYMSY